MKNPLIVIFHLSFAVAGVLLLFLILASPLACAYAVIVYLASLLLTSAFGLPTLTVWQSFVLGFLLFVVTFLFRSRKS